ncbi:MAG: FtsX-like permease family protein [Bacillota bacterium]
MNLYHIVLSSLRRRKVKILLVMLGLVIGIATVVSTNSLVEAMKTELARQQASIGANLVILPDTGGLTFTYGGIAIPEVVIGSGKKLTTSDVETIKNLPSRSLVRAVAPTLLGIAATGEQKVIIAGTDLQSEFMTKPWLNLQREEGSGPDTGLQFSHENGEGNEGMQLLDLGREDLQQLFLADDQVILGSAVAATLGSYAGDVLLLEGRVFQVFSLLETNGSSEDNFVFMNLPVAQGLLGRPGEVSTIQLALDSTGNEGKLLDEISVALPHARAISLRQALLGRDKLLNRLSRLGLTLSLLALFAGLLVVTLTIGAAVRERTREIGVFRAIGFRKMHVFKMILLEGVFISLCGGLLGYTTGVLLTRLLGPFLLGMESAIPWRLDLFLTALLLALVMGLLASLYPAQQAAKLDPAEALRFI